MRRRDFLAGTAGAATLLSGCSLGTGDDARPENGTGDGSQQPYSVTMEPTGAVELDSVPRSVAQYFPGYADMSVALGHGDSTNAIGYKSRYHTDVYDELDGVSVDTSSMTQLYGENGISKETFYALDSDLHVIDPRWLSENFKSFEQKDVDEIATSVAPFLGNTIFRRTDSWHDYRYYTLYGAFEKVAKVFREEERFARIQRFHDSFIADVQAKLPPADSRPNALLTFARADEPEAFSPYRISDKGTNKKQFHDLGIADALAGTGVEGLSTNNRGQIDYETMLEVDPDSILLRGHEDKTERQFRNTVLAFMKQHDTASRLTAVRNGDVFRGGPIYAGPIHNLFLTERFAENYFPDSYSGKLFSRSELSGIITGDA